MGVVFWSLGQVLGLVLLLRFILQNLVGIMIIFILTKDCTYEIGIIKIFMMSKDCILKIGILMIFIVTKDCISKVVACLWLQEVGTLLMKWQPGFTKNKKSSVNSQRHFLTFWWHQV